MVKSLLSIALALLIIAPSTMADRRKYGFTYQFMTIPQDASELEFYQTTKVDETDSWEYRIEVEHGLTHRWDVSVYQIFAQDEGEAFKWDAFQVRTRYKLAEYGAYPLNPLLYLEYRRKIDLGAQNKLEAKLILDRNFDRVNLAVNPVYEFFWAPGDPVHEIGLDAGLSYEFSYKFALGVESVSRVEFLPDEDNETASYFGPVVSFASGPIWYTVSTIFGLTDESNDARVRFLMGVDL